MRPAREEAVIGGGCFWCLEAVYQSMRGVEEVRSGYAGGHVENPSYRAVCTGTTGHAEVVRITFDPEELPFDELLRIFFTIHDPTTPNRQGADVGPQYRSIILHQSAEQREIAERVIAELTEEELWDDPIVTEIVPLERFWGAEAEHHRYFERNPGQGYCQAVVAPKVAKARSAFRYRFVGDG